MQVHTAHCTLHSEYSVYSIHYTLYSIHYAVIHHTVYSVHYTLYSIHYTVYTIHYTPYSVHYTLYVVQSALNTVLLLCRICKVRPKSLITEWQDRGVPTEEILAWQRQLKQLYKAQNNLTQQNSISSSNMLNEKSEKVNIIVNM